MASRLRFMATLAGAALWLGACGNVRAPVPPSHAGAAPPAQLSAPSGASPDARAIAVIRAWSGALRRGDVAGAARFFALPSAMVNGGSAGGLSVIEIHSRRQAEAANASLPCGARFISAARHGRYLDALFELTARSGPGGADCTGGGTARTDFVIRHGLIVLWARAPDEPGDGGAPGSGGTTPGSGGGTPGSGGGTPGSGGGTPAPPTPQPQPGAGGSLRA